MVFTCFILLTFLRFLIDSRAAAEVFPLLYDCKTNLFWKVLFKYTGYILIFATGFSVISYWGMTIRLRLRTKVTRLLHRKLFEKANVSNYLNSLTRKVDNVDQRVAADVEQATLLLFVAVMGDGVDQTGIVAPFFSVALSLGALGKLPSFTPVLYVVAWTLITFMLSIVFYPMIGKRTFKQQMLEGAFRFVHTRVKEFAESITFYQGIGVEKESSNAAFSMILKNRKKID